jgi:tropomyosin
LSQLRLEADNAVVRAEEAEAKIKKLEQELLTKDQDIQSLNHRLTNAEGQLDAAEDKLKDAKNVRDEHDASKSTNDGLQRKIQLLEEELDRAEKTQKETTERCARAADRVASPPSNRILVRWTQAPSGGSEGRALRTPGANP